MGIDEVTVQFGFRGVSKVRKITYCVKQWPKFHRAVQNLVKISAFLLGFYSQSMRSALCPPPGAGLRAISPDMGGRGRRITFHDAGRTSVDDPQPTCRL